MSVPFFHREFTFTQPDGSTFKARGTGDQHQAVFQTLDGYTITQDPATGYYHYAKLNPGDDYLESAGAAPGTADPKALGLATGARPTPISSVRRTVWNGLAPSKSRWRERRERHRAAVRAAAAGPGIAGAPPQRQTVGTYVGLCLLVQFPDVPGTIMRDEVEKFCNSPGYAGFGNNGSVLDYFSDASGGKLRYTNVVAPYYTAKKKRSYYTNELIPQPVRTMELIREALTWWKSKGFDFSKLTVDDEQYVYAMNVFYAGPRVNNWAKGLWPHSHHLSQPFPLAPGARVFDYQITDMGSELTLGTFCHENGHMICDFPDLYDYGYESSGVGAFCLMCSGPNVSPKNPPHVDAYLKFKAGWASGVASHQAGQKPKLKAGTNEFYLHRRSATEYYILENRFRQGRDASLPSSGLALWHVDELGDNRNEQMTAAQHYECSLVQADGRTDLEHGAGDGDAGDLFFQGGVDAIDATTKPASRWWDGTASGLDLKKIGPAGATIGFET